MRAAAPVALALLSAAACGPDPADFTAVCDGRSYGKAPAATANAPVFVAQRDAPGLRWHARAGFPSTASRDVATVVCVEPTPGPPSRTCVYDDVEVTLRDATWTVTTRAARTAKPLATVTIDAHATDCPKTAMVSYAEEKPERLTPLDDAKLAAAIAGVRR